MINPFFQKAKRRAQKIFSQPEKVKQVLDDAIKRSEVIDKTKKKTAVLGNNLKTLFAMLKAYITGGYSDIPKSTLIKILAGIIYFLWFADLVPDILGVIGLVDDAAVVAWVLNSIQEDLDRFRTWQTEQEQTQSPEAV